MSAADEAARTEAAEFIRREMQDGFLHPGIVAPGSRAHEALSTLVAAATEKRSQPVEVTDEMVTVYYYDHSCEWITKYCDEYHKRSAVVQRAALGAVEPNTTEDDR